MRLQRLNKGQNHNERESINIPIGEKNNLSPSVYCVSSGESDKSRTSRRVSYDLSQNGVSRIANGLGLEQKISHESTIVNKGTDRILGSRKRIQG